MNILAALWVSAAGGLAIYALLTLPTWLFSSMNRSTLWCLRDRVFDGRWSGDLPDIPEVDDLITYLEDLIVALPRLTAFKVWWFHRYHSDVINRTRRSDYFGALAKSTPLNEPYVDLLHNELRRIILRQYFLGSWHGLLLLAPRQWQDLKSALRRSDLGTRYTNERWHEHDLVVDVEQVVPHLRKRTDEDLLAAAG